MPPSKRRYVISMSHFKSFTTRNESIVVFTQNMRLVSLHMRKTYKMY
jgi:hypothetical protein